MTEKTTYTDRELFEGLLRAIDAGEMALFDIDAWKGEDLAEVTEADEDQGPWSCEYCGKGSTECFCDSCDYCGSRAPGHSWQNHDEAWADVIAYSKSQHARDLGLPEASRDYLPECYR
jgi:hypothetical protein